MLMYTATGQPVDLPTTSTSSTGTSGSTVTGSWSACVNGLQTRRVVQSDGTVTLESRACTTTSSSSGTSTTGAGSSGASVASPTPAKKRPWGTIALVGLGLVAAGAAAWEIDAHHHGR